ncbi:f-actin capping protein beta subunit, putative [Trypanosoma cruzi]|nr:f-actin capping protein beta subunit, putative [Trypanosoma cruzi]
MRESTNEAEDVAAAGASLLARYPPRKGRMILDNIVTLCKYRDAEAVLNIIYRQVSPVDTPWPVLQCPSAATRWLSATPHYFIAFEYNRMGDGYRCPLCNKYVSGDKFVSFPLGSSGLLRQMESAANRVFVEYAELYYGKESTASVYTWECDPANKESKMGLAVMIKHRAKSLNGNRPGHFPLREKRGVWQSAHVGIVDISSGAYYFQSSFYIDAFVPIGSLPNKPDAVGRFNGSVASRLFSFESREAIATPDLDGLIASIGEQVQLTENSFYGRLFEIYFSKAQLVAEGMRVIPQSTLFLPPQSRWKEQPAASRVTEERSQQADFHVIGQASDTNAMTHSGAVRLDYQFAEGSEEIASPLPRGKESTVVDDWEEAYDDDGNRYYYKEVTGETAWEKPDVGKLVLDILRNLHLMHSPDKYYRRLKKYFRQYETELNIDTFYSLTNEDQMLELDDGSTMTALEYIVPAYGDRRKIEVYIAQNARKDA